jgi:hypothetical protein
MLGILNRKAEGQEAFLGEQIKIPTFPIFLLPVQFWDRTTRQPMMGRAGLVQTSNEAWTAEPIAVITAS